MATVVAHGIRKDEGKTPQLWITFQNEDGEELSWFSGMGVTGKGFSDKAFTYCCKALTALGWNPEQHDFDLSLLAYGEVLVGSQAQIVVENDTYEGETRTKIKWINDPAGSGNLGTIDPSQEAGFFAKIRARAYQAKAGGASPPQRQQQPRPVVPPVQKDDGIDYSDIPFALLLAVGMSIVGMVA